MKLKLLKPIIYQNANGGEEKTEYVFIKKPLIGDLTSPRNIGIYSAILHKAQKAMVLGQKEMKGLVAEEENKENEEEGEKILKDDENALATAEGLIYGCVLGGYENIEEDLLNKCKVYFDKFLFVDEGMTQNISSNLIKEQLIENGDVLDLYKIIFCFFFQASVVSSKRKIER